MFLDFEPDESTYRAELRAFVDHHLPADWQSMFVGDDTWKATKQFCASLAELGWLTPAWPREYGGSAASIWSELVTQEEMWAHNEPRGPQYMNINWIGPAIMRFGTPAQKDFFLPRMARGELLWGQGFSEPEAGSDLAALRTSARLDGDHFVLNGRKIWTSYGDIADYYFMVCRTLSGSKRRDGCSVLLLDMTLPGIEVRQIDTILGAHRQSEAVFSDVLVPRDALLGRLHDGWRVATTALSYERVGIPQYARAVRVLSRLANTFGAEWDDTRREMFARTVAHARAAELTTYYAAFHKDSGEPPRAVASVSRVHNSLLERRVADASEALAGGAALIGGSDEESTAGGEIETHWRNAPTVTVAAGSLEIQLEIIAGDGLGLPRS
jgi:alkylation response protein AidB-like acyl-CoA dehydrogenase